MTESRTLMHVDLCHAYCWVVRKPSGEIVLTFDEREDSDLALHGRFGASDDGEPCERCLALRDGAEPTHTTREIPELPEDGKEAFAAVLTAIATEDKDR